MGNRETAGIVTILVGVLLVVGAIRGTWSKIFKDVILDQPGPQSTSHVNTTPTSNQTTPVNQQSATIPYQVPVGYAGGSGAVVS